MTLEEKVKQVITELRPQLMMDGGDVEFMGIEGSKVKVRLRGACASCPVSQITLKQWIEKTIKERIPEVGEVVSV